MKELDYTTDAFGREAVDFIERHKAGPWFLYLAFNAVHTPMDATKERVARFSHIANPQRRAYDAMMLAMDEAIGRVRAKLADSNLEQDTLVFFISDNGGPTMKGVTINGASNAPLRGSKRTTLEGGIRVPFVVSWKGKVEPAVYQEPAIQLDLHATALAAANVEVKPAWKLDGVNLLPYLSGEKSGSPHDALYWRFGEQMAIRAGDWKLVRHDRNADSNESGVSPPRLYNLAADIGETRDLAATRPDKLKALQTQWDAWNATLVNPLWGAAPRAGSSAKPRRKKGQPAN